MVIVILNCYSRNSLAVASSLKSEYVLFGGEVENNRRLKPDRFFKYRGFKSIFRHVNPDLDPEKCCREVIEQCVKVKADAVVATGTTMTNWLSEYKNTIQAQTSAKVLVEDFDKLDRLSDKWLCYLACCEAGVPVPKTVLLESADAFSEDLSSFSLPVVIKPRNSSASKGVMFFNSKHTLRAHLKASGYYNRVARNPRQGLVAQEVISGALHDVTSCSKNGIPVALLTQQRLMTLYDFGGGGILNKTTDNRQIRTPAERLIRHINWNGILVFDFILDFKGRPYLLECNPKFWGTTQLTIDAGLNVAQLLVDLFLLDKPIQRKSKYEIDLLYRWIFPECVYHWTTKPRTPRRILKRIANTFKSYGAHRKMTNLKPAYFRHLLGIVINGNTL